ncbi:hypothetical protein [Streptomyces phaeochromogenes]|uniref:hypothetical protein n=1 Tax=Streptomyces phaeochromogenes TaxID=1923 RepID=UPI003694C1E4
MAVEYDSDIDGSTLSTSTFTVTDRTVTKVGLREPDGRPRTAGQGRPLRHRGAVAGRHGGGSLGDTAGFRHPSRRRVRRRRVR